MCTQTHCFLNLKVFPYSSWHQEMFFHAHERKKNRYSKVMRDRINELRGNP